MKKHSILIANTRHFYGGGDSTYALNLGKLLRGKGHNVSYFAMMDSRNIEDRNSDLFVSHIDFRELNRNRSILNGLMVLSRSIYSIEAEKKFAKLIDREKPDLIHLQNIHAHLTPSIIVEASRRDIPVVWTLHDYKLVCPNSHFLIDKTNQICEDCSRHRYYKAIFHRCKKNSLLASFAACSEAYIHNFLRFGSMVDAYLCPSRFLQLKLINEGYSKAKTIHLSYFLDGNQLNCTREDRGYILFLGKLESIKGIYYLLEAAKENPLINVKLAGNLDPVNSKHIQKLFSSNIDYLGMKYGDELSSLTSLSRVVVLPSIWYENQPFSILEAFAHGKPVIASRLGGMIELVKDGERGLLVEPGNAAELATAMKWMIDHPVEAQKMGENALAYVQQNHSEATHYEQLMTIYESIISR